MTYLIRIDDFPTGIRPKIPGYRQAVMDILGEFERYSIPYILGVVPAVLEEQDFRFLQERKNMVVAMHGYDHRNVPSKRLRTSYEFNHMNVEQILPSLIDGKRILKELATSMFIPPGNEYSIYLLRALKFAGFKYCFGTFPREWRHKSPLPILHSYPPFYGRARHILEAMKKGRPGVRSLSTIEERIRQITYKTAIGVWERIYQTRTDSLPSKLIVIALHWTWEYDELQNRSSRLGDLCRMLSAEEVLDPKSLLYI